MEKVISLKQYFDWFMNDEEEVDSVNEQSYDD